MRPATSTSTMRAAALAAALLSGGGAALAGAALLAPEARAQDSDAEALEQALTDVYVLEPADAIGLRATFERLRVRQQRNFRVEAGLALAEASISLASDNALQADRARDAAEKAAAQNPDHRITRRAQGLASLALGRLLDDVRDRRAALEKAVKAFEHASERPTPERWIDTYRKAQALRELGRTTEASTACDQALMLIEEPTAGAFGPGGKERAKALVGAAKARVLADAGATGEAGRLLGAALETSPQDAGLRAELGLLLERRGLPELSRDALAAALAADAAAPAEARLKARRREEATVALARAEVAASAGGPRVAEGTTPSASVAAALAAIEPYAASATAGAEALALRGSLRRLAGRSIEAQGDTADALSRDGFSVEARETRARLLLDHIAPSAPTSTPDVAEALAQAETCAALEPRSPRRARLLADALRAAGRAAESDAAAAKAGALAEAAAALATDGGEAPADTALALARRAADWGRDEEALEAATRALAADPSDGLAQVAAVRAHMGIAPPRTAEARAAAAALVKRFPQVHDAHTLAALAAQLAGDAAGAREAAQRAMQLDPRDGAAQRILSGGTEAAGPSTGAPARKLPQELADAARRFTAPDPIVRADAGAELMADAAGVDLVVAQLERDPDPFVVGALANILAARNEKRAGPALRRMLHALPSSQPVARGRVLRALGKVGEPAILPEILEVIMEGAGDTGDAGHAAILSLMSGMEETSAVVFQRELIESTDDQHKMLAPVLAEHLVKDRITRLQAEGRAASSMISIVRGVLLLLLGLLAYVRFRFYQRDQQLKSMAQAQQTRRLRKPGAPSGEKAPAPAAAGAPPPEGGATGGTPAGA